MLTDANLKLSCDGLELDAALFLPNIALRHPGLVLCHGLPSGAPPDPSDPGYPGLAAFFAEAGLATLIFNFRGTGASQGNYDPAGWHRDLEAALDYMEGLPDVDPDRIGVLGFSAGASVAICTVARRPRVAALVACAAPSGSMRRGDPWDTIQRARQIGIIRDPDFPPNIEAWTRGWEENAPIDWIERVAPRPILLIHGTADDVVPFENAELLLARVSASAELYPVLGGGHRLRQNSQAMDKARDWLRKALTDTVLDVRR